MIESCCGLTSTGLNSTERFCPSGGAQYCHLLLWRISLAFVLWLITLFFLLFKNAIFFAYSKPDFYYRQRLVYALCDRMGALTHIHCCTHFFYLLVANCSSNRRNREANLFQISARMIQHNLTKTEKIICFIFHLLKIIFFQ